MCYLYCMTFEKLEPPAATYTRYHWADMATGDWYRVINVKPTEVDPEVVYRTRQAAYGWAKSNGMKATCRAVMGGAQLFVKFEPRG